MESLIHDFLKVDTGYGYGYGSVSGSGDGYGSGNGSGDGSGDGSGLISFIGSAVYEIDGVPTLIYHIRGNVARGAILNRDLTTTPCYIVKQDNLFAHGETLHAAQEELLEKMFDDMPLCDRIDAFVETHKAGKNYPNTDFFSWHHLLTGSCEMGRRQFAKDRGIDLNNGSMTPEEFIRLTKTAYGGNVIRMLQEHYPEN